MSDIRTSKLGGIPFGISSQRPSNPESGQPFFNGEAQRLELYTASGWNNIVQEVPGVSGITGQYLESNASNTIGIIGTNFVSGAVAYATGTNGVEITASSTVYNSIVQLSATFTGLDKQYEPYDIKVVNPSNLFGILSDALFINETPIWSTTAGSLGSYNQSSSVSISLSASDPESSSLTYSISSGSLPSGLSLNSSTGAISGTAGSVSGDTTYSFTVSVTDGSSSISRSFSITILEIPPVWSTSSPLPTFTKNIAYSTTLVANDDSGIAPTYTLVSGSLPTGLSLSSAGVISGTASSSLTTTFTVRATDSHSKYADRTFTLPNAAPSWITSSVTPISGGTAYSYQLNASDDGTLTYSVLSGTLPTGITLSSSGLISGTCTGLYTTSNVTFRATDDNGLYADATFSISVNFPSVSGGTLTSDATYYYNTFTGNGNLVISGATLTADVLIVGGGGGGGCGYGSGGGAGQVAYGTNQSLTVGTKSITIGAQTSNNSTVNTRGANGNSTTFDGKSAAGGGGGGSQSNTTGNSGGSGGGGSDGGVGGSSVMNTISGYTNYGNAGGSAGLPNYAYNQGSGGGGAGSAGLGYNNNGSRNGGSGIALLGVTVAGGGGGSLANGSGGSDGVGGSGIGGNASSATGGNGTANTGSGGAGSGSASASTAGAGASGRVVIRYTRAAVGG